MKKLPLGVALSSLLAASGCMQAAPSLIRTEDVAADAACAAGGKRLSFGLDLDGSGVLEDAEVSSSTIVCNGAKGTDGVNGETGPAPVLTAFAAGTEGTNCAATGGVKVVVGTSEPVFVCNGQPGAAGAAGQNGTNGTPGTNGETPVVTAFAAGTEGTNCAATGGVKVVVGTNTPVYVCNGEAGAPGPAGQNGTNGMNGTNGANGETPVVTAFAAGDEGTNCPVTGGVKVVVGNSNPVFVCNGEGGATGDPGPTGQNGSNGADGTNGFNSLIATVDEPVSLNCPAAGVRLDVGLDNGDGGGTERDGVLQPGEVDQTRYLCNPYDPVLRTFPNAPGSVGSFSLSQGTPWTGELPMMVAWDGTHHWFTTGSDRQGGRLIKTDASLQFVADYAEAGDTGNFRSVVTKLDGLGPALVTRAWDEYISTFTEGPSSISLTHVAQLVGATPGQAYSRDPVVTWDGVNGEWISRAGDTYFRFDATYAYLGSWSGPDVNSNWPLSLVARKGRMVVYESGATPARLVVYSRDGVKLEQLELADGPGTTFGLSIANGKVWLSDATTTPMEFKAYDVLK